MRHPPVSKRAPKTMDDVRAAFDTRSVLRLSPTELEELLATVACETISDPAARARAQEMGETMRQLLENRRSERWRRRPSKLAFAAMILALAALLCCGAQAYYSWSAYRAAVESSANLAELVDSMKGDETQADQRTKVTLAELARRAPSIRTGSLQAWWAGEQARQVQRLEAQAKRQTLAGDREGAARSVSRADAVRYPFAGGFRKAAREIDYSTISSVAR